MGWAGFVWAKGKRPEAYITLRNYYSKALRIHRRNSKRLMSILGYCYNFKLNTQPAAGARWLR